MELLGSVPSGNPSLADRQKLAAFQADYELQSWSHPRVDLQARRACVLMLAGVLLAALVAN